MHAGRLEHEPTNGDFAPQRAHILLHSRRREEALPARHPKHNTKRLQRAADQQRLSKATNRLLRVHSQAARNPKKEPLASIGCSKLWIANPNERGAIVRVLTRLLFVSSRPTTTANSAIICVVHFAVDIALSAKQQLNVVELTSKQKTRAQSCA